MSVLWNGFLEVFQVALFWLTQFYGGHLASAIISFSILGRLLLLPLTVRMTLRTREHARRLRALQPELARIKEKWGSTEPERMARETMATYRRHGVKPFDGRTLRGSLIQAPLFLGLFRAVQNALSGLSAPQVFLWVRDLSRPDVGVALAAALLVALGSVSAASPAQPRWAMILPATATFVMAMMLSSGFALYLGSSGLVSTLQGLLVRRAEARLDPPLGGRVAKTAKG